MNNFSGRLPATSCHPSSATPSSWPWPCTGLSCHAVKWVREMNPWENQRFFLHFLFICLFYLFWVRFFHRDQVCHPASRTVRTILQEGHGRNELLVRARSCTGQLKHPLAHRVSHRSLSPCGDPLPAMVLVSIFVSMSATTDSLLNCPEFTLKQCKRSVSAERCCLAAVLTCFAQMRIEGRRQWKIRNRTAKDVINNVCEVNLNLDYVSQELLMIGRFAFLEMRGIQAN